MPVFKFEIDGEPHTIYAGNIWDANDEIFAEFGDVPETLTEVK